MSRKSLPISIFAYNDYRTLLFDLFEEWQRRHRRTSYRKFSELAGFKTVNFLKLIIDGKRNLSDDAIGKLTSFFDFNKKESYYFENLVHMNQARSHAQKNYYYKRLGKTPGYRMISKGELTLFEYYSNWYYPAIREMVSLKDFDDDPKWIAAHLTPPIRTSEAKKAFERLAELGMIVKNGEVWEQADPILSTGPQINSMAVMNYHKEMIQKAGESLENISRELRNVSSLTVAVSPEVYQEMVQEIYSFQQRLLELAGSDNKQERVYQVNFQLFPVTSSTKGEEE